MPKLEERSPGGAWLDEAEQLLDVTWPVLGGEPLPALELEETEKHWIVRAELPGIDPRGVEVTVTEAAVRIAGEKRSESGRGGYLFTERRFGCFERRVTLPGPVDPARARATFRHGLLTVAIPKGEHHRIPSEST